MEFRPPDEFDDYVNVRSLRGGGMGQVYLAEDALLARPVAIKFMAGDDPDPAERQRFLIEARAAARIHHPNVVAVYRVGELGDRPYIVSELVRGQTLAELGGPMPSTAVLAIALELGRGLAASHRSGVVHGDVAPANAIVGDDGVAKLCDFGLARVVHDGERDEPAVAGTPDYMAPELWAGGRPTRAADVYAFGALLHTLVVGAPPFADVAPAVLGRAVGARDARPVRDRVADVDPGLAEVIDRCLARDPAARFATGEQVRAALEQIVRHRDRGAAPDGNPYRGLRPFEASHRALFFGRAPEIGALVDRLRGEPMIVLTGDSGVGKSSLVRAGVVPAIVDGALADGRRWTAVTMVPGHRPLTALAAALAEPGLVDRVLAEPAALARELGRRAAGGGLVLFVDQLEELVTVGDPVEVAALEAGLAGLTEGVPGVRVLATVRADFLARFAALPRLGQDLGRLLHFVRPMTADHLREVITGPAAATDVGFESDALIDELVQATERAGAGGLPLLSFALAALWDAHDRARRLITIAALADMGGVAGALTRHADGVIGALDPVARGQARHLLSRLVTTLGTRVRRAERDLVTASGGRDVLDALVRGRLLVAQDDDGSPVYELAHEVLVHGWATLREWLDHDAAAHACHERLAIAAGEWRRLDRRADVTWSGPRLTEALALAPTRLTALERDFLRASGRQVRRRRWLVRGAITLAAVLAASAYGGQRYLAARRLDRAVTAELVAADAARTLAAAAAAASSTAAAEAYQRVDAGDVPAGERRWLDVRARHAEAARAYRDATSHLESALAKDPARAAVRARLGDVLLDRARLAERIGDADGEDELLSRLTSHDDDGHRRRAWTAPGRLSVPGPVGAAVEIDGVARGAAPAVVELAIGVHRVAIAAPGRMPVVQPVEIERGATVTIDAAPPRVGDVPPGFVEIPAGEVWFGDGGDDATRREFYRTVPIHRRAVAAFRIATLEVTIADWLAWLDGLPADERARRAPRIENISGGFELAWRGGTWHLALRPIAQHYQAALGEPIVYRGRAVRAVQDWRRFPVTAISADDAVVYAGWLDQTGRIPGARLCTELEWERAARGADRRPYPGGDQPGDANLDQTYGRELMGPDEVGSHPGSRSPFAVDDLAGNAMEWVASVLEPGYLVRGGSYYHEQITARIANRQPLPSGFRDMTVGLRLCASLPTGRAR